MTWCGDCVTQNPFVVDVVSLLVAGDSADATVSQKWKGLAPHYPRVATMQSSQLFVVDVPPDAVGRPYVSLFTTLVQQRRCVPLALRRRRHNLPSGTPFVVTAPPATTKVQATDAVYLLSLEPLHRDGRAVGGRSRGRRQNNPATSPEADLTTLGSFSLLKAFRTKASP